MAMTLYIIRNDAEVSTLTFSSDPQRIGRSPESDLVLADSTVSSHHATIWRDGEHAFIRDQGSSNGTFVNGTRITGAVEVHDGDRIRLGAHQELVARGEVTAPRKRFRVCNVQDVQHGVSRSIDGTRFYIGGGDDADWQIEDERCEAAISLHPDGEVWVAIYDRDGDDEHDREGPVEMGEIFSVGSRKFRIIEVTTLTEPTVVEEGFKFPYRLIVTLTGVSGPEATLVDPRSSLEHTVSAENRAILLYVLAKQAVDAMADPTVDSWCADEDVARGIWGKRGSADANSLHVLVHRLRKELKKAGFDPWFIEKRRKAIRLALRDIQIS